MPVQRVIWGTAIDGIEPEIGCIGWWDRFAPSVTFYSMIPDLSISDINCQELRRQAGVANVIPRIIARERFRPVSGWPQCAD